MSLNKDSTIDEVSTFLKPIVKKEDIISRFKSENIKGNELFFLSKEDFDSLGVKFSTKLLNKLKEIENSQSDIKCFNENISGQSTKEQINTFLKTEIKLSEEILEKMKEINGEKFIKFKEVDLKNLGMKLGERKKILKYLETIATTETKKEINVTHKSSSEEVKLFLKIKYNLDLDTELSGEEFFKITQEDFEDLEINDQNIQKQILDYIKEYKLKEKNKVYVTPTPDSEDKDEENYEEENFNHFLLIDVEEYVTSEEEINKCPINKKEGFIELCKYMNIETQDNCSKINFEQANSINLKVVSLWGTIEALLSFFEKRKMAKSLEYFKAIGKNSSGIYLLINEEKSFAYIVIWPGKMTYFYRKMDEPQKDLLLSLVRTGFSLSDNNVICLTEKQQIEFDFQAIKYFNSDGAYKSTVGEVIFKEEKTLFELGENFSVLFKKDEIEGEIKNINLNNSSVFIHVLTKEKINYEEFDKISFNKLQFNEENISFHPDFNLTPTNLYTFLKKFDNLKKKWNQQINEIKGVSEKIIKIIETNYINTLEILIEKLQKSTFNKCEYCKNKFKNSENINIFICNNHSFHIVHQKCIVKSDKDIQNAYCNDNEKKVFRFGGNELQRVLAICCKNILLKKDNTKFNNNFLNLISEEIRKCKDINKDNILKNLDNALKHIKNYIKSNQNEILNENKEIIDWKNNIINQINASNKSKINSINAWTEYINAFYDKSCDRYLFTYKKYKKSLSKSKIKLFNFYKYNNDNNYLLKNVESCEWNEEEFENYFVRDKYKGILIKKSLVKNSGDFILSLDNKNKNQNFKGCYDYNDKCKILILSNLKEKEEIIIINFNENYKIMNSYKKNLPFREKLIKILIIPYKYESSSNYSLFFTKELIWLIDIRDFRDICRFDIQSSYSKYNLNEMQFLIYEKLLLILFFDNDKNFWDLDVYEINPIEKKFNKLAFAKKDFNFTSKNGKFSVCQIRNEVILYFCYIKNDELIIQLKKLITSVNSFNIETDINKNISEELSLTEGNCVFNYFYHSFIKYPPIGALQYNYYNKKNVKNIYIDSSSLKDSLNFKEYFNELKNICINERGLNYDDLKFELKGLYRKKNIQDIKKLGDLIIKFIEIIPIQIAKIKNYFFKAMSNGKEINKQELYESYSQNNNKANINISIQQYADYIGFGMKNSIFNYYDLPVVVVAFMGSQSIGKSTLSNELVQSFFNVSGMRCTEGVWMAVSLFKGIKEKNKCEYKCKYCSEKSCRLTIHNIDIKCICENCCCIEKCCLFFGEDKEENKLKQNQRCCEERCCLNKGHEKSEHICEISPYSHGFLCVSLDFEGLGTFERSTEQDIDLAMVGAALANSIILRSDKTFDVFMQSRMFNWSEGSKNISTVNSNPYFGGNIVFCQKDIPKNNVEEVRKEFEEKINYAINTWLMSERKRNLKKLNLNDFPIFGIFSKYINSPTPIFNNNEFHKTLRRELIHLVIKNVLMSKGLPNYRTGTEFMFLLQRILAIIDIHDYNVLDSIGIENLKEYLQENKHKAFEIFGIYSIDSDKKFNTFNEFEKDLREDLELLKSSYISNNKQEIDEKINIVISSPNLKVGNFDFNFEETLINITIAENRVGLSSSKKDNSFKIVIEGIKELGLLLLIPQECKEIFEIEDIRKKHFLLWKNIGEFINLSIIEIINNFELFINSLIERRESNIKKWLDNLTSSFDENDVNEIKELNSPLKDRWKICKELCAYCFYRCTKILGHINEHNCGFDHKCHEKCINCEKSINCENYDNCDHFCQNKKAGHSDSHLCSHLHKCKRNCSLNNLEGCNKVCILEYGHEGNCDCKSTHICDKECIYKDCSKGCIKKCYLQYNHKEPHNCGSNDHYCLSDCKYKNKTIGCINEGKCILKLPHSEDNHNCGGNHRCFEPCHLKELSKKCGGICALPLGHNPNVKHICSENHICKEKCFFNGNARGCKEECVLKYGHELPHNCNEKHYCKKICYYKGKSRYCENNNCILPVNHKEKCTCGANHLCKNKCSIESCNRDCNLPFDHQEPCNCKEFHECQGVCSLKENSLEDTCNSKCKYQLNHEGPCYCEISLENHKCNKNCSSQECTKNCSLNAGHKELCICGECNCKDECDFKNNSRNCHNKCVKKYGHEGPHQCEEKLHLCNQTCKYHDLTKKNGGCNLYCGLPADHESSEHYCDNPKEKHICKGICSLNDKSSSESCDKNCKLSIEHEPPCFCQKSILEHICNKTCYLKDKFGCKINCSLPINHDGNCLCSSGENQHLCQKQCSLFEKSRIGCKEKCCLIYNHKDDIPCLCSASLKDHICNKECCLKADSREGCLSICNLSLDHVEKCICQNSPDIHICNKECSLKNYSLEGSCNVKCVLNTGHEGNCKCLTQKHECIGLCKYKDASREGCLGKCSKEAGHKGDHFCENEPNKHKCNHDCDLKNVSRIGCSMKCDKIPLHEGEHLCDSKEDHICKADCDLKNKCSKGCKQICSKKSKHEGAHDCQSQEHICNKTCHLEKVSRGCKTKCRFLYGHNGECICSVEKYEHQCKEKCTLCGGDIFCEYKYKHSEPNHLCNREHVCNKECQQKGICEIITNMKMKTKKQYNLKKSYEKIEYEEENEQKESKKKCCKIIQKGQICHLDSHCCPNKIHKCGFKCKQCSRLCDLEYNHESSFHYCRHGQIKNAYISTEENDITLLFNQTEYIFQNEETACMFTCTQYCREQGRGHIHIINEDNFKELGLHESFKKRVNIQSSNHNQNSEEKEEEKKENNNNNLEFIKNIRKINDHYECKCEYFWKSFLKFQFDEEFETNLKNSFNMCPAKCPSCKEKNIKTYCELDLWHKPESNSNKNKDYWISRDGHKFKCKHVTPSHTIFVIDKSGSMFHGDIQPNLQKIKDNYYFNNRLGSVINHIFNYVKKRDIINKEDIFSLVSFSNNADIILDNYHYNQDNNDELIDICMNKIKCEGNTLFKEGLLKAKEILGKIDRRKYKPVIILFSDGADEDKKKTFEIVNDVSLYIFN